MRSLEGRKTMLQPRALMTKSGASCKPEDSLGVAAKLMWDADCGAVPVVGADGAVKGMITERDACAPTRRAASPSSTPTAGTPASWP
jgi:predicted transcriptional regulator